MAKKDKSKCCECGKRKCKSRPIKRIKLYRSYQDCDDDKNGYYDYFCQECEENIPEG